MEKSELSNKSAVTFEDTKYYDFSNLSMLMVKSDEFYLLSENGTLSALANVTSNSSNSNNTAIKYSADDSENFFILKIVLTVVYVIIFVTGLLGNIVTCIVISKNRNMHTAVNYYLFSLAISDLLLLISGNFGPFTSYRNAFSIKIAKAVCPASKVRKK